MQPAKKILLLGQYGQVGWELQRALATLGNIIIIDRDHQSLCGDLSDPAGMATTVAHLKPDIIVNAAAYTNVDGAENNIEQATRINHLSVAALAQEAAKLGALFVHYSTDYVFDGQGSHFRDEQATPAPINVYGATKLAGEEAIRRNCPYHLIFRTSWVYATRGNNFIKTILKLATEREKLDIINDQYGAPTSAELLADCTTIAIRAAIEQNQVCGTYHLVANGVTNWYDYANFILERYQIKGSSFILKEICAITTNLYVRPAKRPLNSRLNNNKFQQNFNVQLPKWQSGVERVIDELSTH